MKKALWFLELCDPDFPQSAGWSQEPLPPLAGNGGKFIQEIFLPSGLGFSLNME
jgi:hypothetical protein